MKTAGDRDSSTIFVFDSHPVQYKAPVYRELDRLRPANFKVVFYTDCSVRGYQDEGFGIQIAWDTPLLSGFDSVVLNNECGRPLSGFASLHGRGIRELLIRQKPRAVVLSQLLYSADLAVWNACRQLRLPIWLRAETQDEAFRRKPLKTLARYLTYRVLYAPLAGAFYFGELNRQHLIRHGIPPARLRFSPFCVPSPVQHWNDEEKQRLRTDLRGTLGVGADDVLVMFSGKLIPKKNPGLIIDAVGKLSQTLRRRIRLLFVGAGTLKEELEASVAQAGLHAHFAGFVNQSQLPEYYLAADILILPSRRMGETWGLVVNEALHAGCGVVMTDAVGCHAEFGGWERVRVIREDDAVGCATAILELAGFQRSFDWCSDGMVRYSVRGAAEGLAALVG